MTIAITHTKVSAIADSGDATLVEPSDWNAGHSLSMATSRLAGRTTSGAGTFEEITVGTGLNLSAGALTSTVSPVSDVIFAAAPNQDFDLTNGGVGGAVTIITKSVTGISAGDQITLDMWFTILNNSGANRAYTSTFALGTLSLGAAETNTLVAASNRMNKNIRINFAISASNLAYIQGAGITPANPSAANAFGGISTGTTTDIGWNSTTNDVTGNQTLSFTMSSPNTTATQTLTLHSYTIRKIATI